MAASLLAALVAREDGVELPLPDELASRYGGPLRVPERAPFVYANFVATLDGVVSFDAPGVETAAQVSGGHPADLFVLALLRAVADAVVVGAGTLRTEPRSVWTAESVVPELAAAFAELRSRLRRPPHPVTVIVSASGDIDPALPVFRGAAPVVVATTAEGVARSSKLPSAVRVRAVAERAPIPSRAIVDLAERESGGGRILTEGGPTLLGRFLDERVVDELFLTIAPLLAGRSRDRRRLALVEGVAFDPARAPRGRLLTLRSADDYLFARYALR